MTWTVCPAPETPGLPRGRANLAHAVIGMARWGKLRKERRPTLRAVKNDQFVNDYTNPGRTLQLLDRLERLGFSDRAFAILHDLEKPQTIAAHRKHCEQLRQRNARFNTRGNELLQQRLDLLLHFYEAGGFTARSSMMFEHLAIAVHLGTPDGQVVSPARTAD